MALNPYEQLGVAPDADEAAIKKAYRRKARECHPDRNPDDPHATTKMQLVQEAYEILMDPERRARFDHGEDPAKKIDTLEARATALLAGTIIQVLKQADAQQALEHPEFQIVQALHEALDQMRSGAASRVKAAERAVRGLERQLKRFKHKGEGENLLGAVLGEQLVKINLQLAKFRSDAEEIGAALNLLDAYEELPAEDLFTQLQVRILPHPGYFGTVTA